MNEKRECKDCDDIEHRRVYYPIKKIVYNWCTDEHEVCMSYIDSFHRDDLIVKLSLYDMFVDIPGKVKHVTEWVNGWIEVTFPDPVAVIVQPGPSIRISTAGEETWMRDETRVFLPLVGEVDSFPFKHGDGK